MILQKDELEVHLCVRGFVEDLWTLLLDQVLQNTKKGR